MDYCSASLHSRSIPSICAIPTTPTTVPSHSRRRFTISWSLSCTITLICKCQHRCPTHVKVQTIRKQRLNTRFVGLLYTSEMFSKLLTSRYLPHLERTFPCTSSFPSRSPASLIFPQQSQSRDSPCLLKMMDKFQDVDWDSSASLTHPTL